MKRLGIFGGTFNPPHNGHLSLAEAATSELDLESLLFVPARIPPHKEVEGCAQDDRLAMTKFLVNSSPSYALCEKEFQREGPSYTIDTLRELRSEYPATEFYLLMGGDHLASFRLWRDWRKILSMATLVVMRRDGFDRGAALSPEAKVHVLRVEEMNVSSSEIRGRVNKGLPVSDLVPRDVENYIFEKKLYQSLTHSTL